MAFWGYRPVLPEFTIENPKEDFRTARVIEQYHLGEKALFMPGGVIPGKESRDEESAMGGYHIEQPTIRVIYQGGVEVLTLESRSQAEILFSLLKRNY